MSNNSDGGPSAPFLSPEVDMENGILEDAIGPDNTPKPEAASTGRGVQDESGRFRSSLSWLGLDQSTSLHVAWSLILFFLLTVAVPILEVSFVSCQDCGEEHKHPFQMLVQYSESALATVSFVFLFRALRKYGLRRTLLLNTVQSMSPEIQEGYGRKLHRAFIELAQILLPCFVVELVHKVWWYTYVTASIPFIPHSIVNGLMCSASMLAWLYKTTVFLFMCVLFRLLCSLQILRLEGYKHLLETTTDVCTIMSEHMRIRKQLTVISHRFRSFMVVSLFVITFSQLWSLLVISSAKTINFFRAGDLLVCSVVQLTGLVLCFHGAAKITHRAQGIVAIVSQWHALATFSPLKVSIPQSDASEDSSEQIVEPFSVATYGPTHPLLCYDSSDDLSMSLNIWAPATNDSHHDIEAYQKRQALVTYLEHSGAGISLYGFVLNRDFLYAIFVLEFSLTLFILGKTILL